MLLTTVDVKWLSDALMKDNELAKSFEEHHQSKTIKQHRDAERRLYLKLKEIFDKENENAESKESTS